MPVFRKQKYVVNSADEKDRESSAKPLVFKLACSMGPEDVRR